MSKQFSLTPDQQAICDAIVNNVKNYPGRYDCVIRGYAGTGKSTTISRTIKRLSLNYEIAITSPTHKANQVLKNMIKQDKISLEPGNIMTIHSFLGLKLVYEKQQQVLKLDPYSSNANRMVDILVIDECSMISTDLYIHIARAAHRVRRAIIFIGDECQLPPVEPEKPGTEISSSFGHGVQYRLTEVLRQALDNPIIALATDVRSSVETKVNPLGLITNLAENDMIMKLHDPSDFIDTYYAAVMGDVDNTKDYQKVVFNRIDQYKILAYTNKDVDTYNRILRSMIFPDYGEKLVHGEPIVFSEAGMHCPYNNQQVIRCPKVIQDVWMGFDCYRVDSVIGNFYIVGPNEYAEYEQKLKAIVANINLKAKNPFTKKPWNWGDYYIIKEKINVVQYPYATTIHKSQGSTFDAAWIDMKYINRVPDVVNMSRMLYTAITRPRENLFILQ